jgi:predicted phage terminase large subunit-like protein
MTNKYIPKLPALHSGQQKVKDSEARWKILCAGRRFGKTRLGVQLCMEVALKGGRAWWVAPTFSIARVGWRDIAASAKSFPREIEPNVSLANMQIDLPNGGSIAVRSADNPQRLRGEGLDYLVMDEAAFVKPEVWQEVLRPTLTERKGSALFISTPIGRNNWFYDLWETAEEADNWERFKFATTDNPMIDPEEVEAARKEVGSIVFAQEYLAEFVDAGQGMLRPEWLNYYVQVPDEAGNVKCIVEGSEYYLKALKKFGIVDLATTTNKDSDYTVITSFAVTPDNRLLVIDMQRQKLEGPDIIPAIKRSIDKNKLEYVGIERQGFQTTIIQMAQRSGIRVKDLKSDKDKVTRALPLSARMESGDVFLLRDTHWLPEMEREIMTFPAGAHDDIIDTLSYGVQMLQERRSWSAY